MDRFDKKIKSVQSGQALVSIIIAAGFILIPLLFGMVYMAKVGEAKHKTFEAARYVAWERTVSAKSNAVVGREINIRIFGQAKTGLDSAGDRNPANFDNTDINAMLRVKQKNGTAQIAAFKESNDTWNTTLQQYDTGAASRQNMLRTVTLLDLDNSDVVTATVSVPMAEQGYLEMPANFAISSKNALYYDDWSAAGPGDVESIMEDAVLVNNLPLQQLEAGIQALSVVGLRELGEFEPGKIDPDRVPCERIVQGQVTYGGLQNGGSSC